MQDNLYYPSGEIKATYFKTLDNGECACKWTKYANTYIVENNKVYKRI